MKVLMINRNDAFDLKGGDTIQMLKTKEYLEKMGVEIEVKGNRDIIDYTKYDIVHMFNLMKPHEMYLQIMKCKKHNIKIVISTIYQSRIDLKEYYQNGFYGHSGLAKSIASNTELYNFIKYIRHYIKSNKLWGKGFVKLQKLILSNVDAILPNSEGEYKCLVEELNANSNKMYIIPNGVDDIYLNKILDSVRLRDKTTDNIKVVFVPGRIEPLKNQISIIQALKDTEFNVIFAGKKNVKHKKYIAEFDKLIDFYPNMKYIGEVEYENMKDLYLDSNITILASWYETAGLVALEGGALGSRIVVTEKGYTRCYFGDLATYCNPGDVGSIRMAVYKSLENDTRNDLYKRIVDNFTWEKAAISTYLVYKNILNNI